MPKDTFFNLPEDKQMRIREAAIDEIARSSAAEMSINKIIQTAEISRGSFYQYFENKEDLVHYLLVDQLNVIKEQMSNNLIKCSGNIFDAMILNLDELFIAAREEEKRKTMLRAIASINQSDCSYEFALDFQKDIVDALTARMDRHLLKEKSEDSVLLLVKTLFTLFKVAAVNGICNETSEDKIEQEFKWQVEMLKNGTQGGENNV